MTILIGESGSNNTSHRVKLLDRSRNVAMNF